MLSWAKQTTLLCWVYCNTPLRYAKVWLSFLIRQWQRHSINCDKLATRCQSRSVTSENSDFCFFPWVWKSTKSGSCPYSKQLSDFQFASSGLWDPGSRLSKDKLFMFLHTPWTSLPCKEKYSLKWAICYFLAEDSSLLQKTAHPALRDLYWNGFFPPVNYIIFFFYDFSHHFGLPMDMGFHHNYSVFIMYQWVLFVSGHFPSDLERGTAWHSQ